MSNAMTDLPEPAQRIARLTPLPEVLARIDALVQPVAPRTAMAGLAIGRVMAGDVAVGSRPQVAVALRDGWAVSSEVAADASPYAPVQLRAAERIEVGTPLPPGTDAVAEIDAVVIHDGGAQAIAPVATGEGVLVPGADASVASLLLRTGQRLSAAQAAVLGATGVASISIRAPVVHVRRARAGPDAIIEAASACVARAIIAEGGTVPDEPNVGTGISDGARLADALDDTLQDPRADAVIVVGGTGSGRNDASVASLARLGRVEVHGIALSPGETAAFGQVGARPILLLPGRLDAALAVWLVLGRRMLARLSGSIEEPPAATARLTRKAASTLGIAELIPVRCHGGTAEPLASGYLPLQTLAQANGWILVPADREGYPAGTDVMIRAWP